MIHVAQNIKQSVQLVIIYCLLMSMHSQKENLLNSLFKKRFTLC